MQCNSGYTGVDQTSRQANRPTVRAWQMMHCKLRFISASQSLWAVSVGYHAVKQLVWHWQKEHIKWHRFSVWNIRSATVVPHAMRRDAKTKAPLQAIYFSLFNYDILKFCVCRLCVPVLLPAHLHSAYIYINICKTSRSLSARIVNMAKRAESQKKTINEIIIKFIHCDSLPLFFLFTYSILYPWSLFNHLVQFQLERNIVERWRFLYCAALFDSFLFCFLLCANNNNNSHSHNSFFNAEIAKKRDLIILHTSMFLFFPSSQSTVDGDLEFHRRKRVVFFAVASIVWCNVG